MIGTTVKGPLCDKYDYRRLKATCSEIGVEIRNQKILYPDNFLSYLAKPPRKPAGTNSTHLHNKYMEMDADEIRQPVTKKARVDRHSKQSSSIVTLKTLMNKYKTSDKYELIKAANDCGNVTDDQLLRSMIRHPNWKKMYTVAIEELDIDNRLNNKSYYELFMDFPTTIPGKKTLSYKDTQRCFLDWCDEQTIDPMRYLISAYLVLSMKLPKKNTLYLCGNSNAGKTYMTNALLPFTHMIGSHITSREFAFQECVSKPVILISELTINTQEQAELYKQVFAGETILVNIKNRHAELMNRKPVILTTNHPVWKNVPNETQALRNRCFNFSHLTTSNVVSRFAEKGAAGHHYFQHMFRLIDTHARTMNIKPENMLSEDTMKELRPIATASAIDNDPVDLFTQAPQRAKSDSNDDYIIITDSEFENTSNPEDSDVYNVETDVDSPLFKAMPVARPVQLPTNVPDQISDEVASEEEPEEAVSDEVPVEVSEEASAQVPPQIQDIPVQVPVQVQKNICGLCNTCTQSIRNLIRGCARVDVSTQTNFESDNGRVSPANWVYTTPMSQRINNPYTPPQKKPSPRRRLFLTYKPDNDDIEMELALLSVISPTENSPPLDLIEYPLVDVASRDFSPVDESIDIDSLAFMEPFPEEQEEPEYYITHL